MVTGEGGGGVTEEVGLQALASTVRWFPLMDATIQPYLGLTCRRF